MNVDKIVAAMSLEDKVALLSGADFWQTKAYEKYRIPSLFMSDGPHGLRKQVLIKDKDVPDVNESEPATCFPAEVTSAGSWDTKLLEEIGTAIGEEACAEDVDLVLGPGINMKRNPLCGRNFEYFSEDPVLAGKLASAFIRGVESQGVGSCVKHFACNSQETDRFTSNGVIDERTLREIYLRAFEIVIREGKPSTLMASYPKLDGVHCADNEHLLTDILRNEWGFEGMVVSDWSATNDRVEGVRAGCDLSMPGGSAYMEKEVCEAVQNGLLSEEKVNASASRVLRLIFRAQEKRKHTDDLKTEAHHALAVKAAEKGAVLLKNEDSILPVSPQKENIALVGYMASNLPIQGAGSSHINATKTENPVDCFEGSTYVKGCREDGTTDAQLLAEVSEAAENADLVVVFAGLPADYEREATDREHIKMPEGHVEMIETAVKANPNTVVVLLCGSAVECPWAEDVKAILYMGLPGQGGARACFNLLTGASNPSGKLAETWPLAYKDVPSSDIYCKTRDALYQEGIYIGYRYYEKADIPVRWPFGFGLSYTTFSYSSICADTHKASIIVTNSGKRAGEEVVQLFISRTQQDGIHRPLRELKGFTKVYLEAGESKLVEFNLDKRDFTVWNHGWMVEAGDYCLQIGSEKCVISMEGEHLCSQNSDSWYFSLKGKPSLEDWQTEMGRRYLAPVLEKGCFTMENTIEEMKEHSATMERLYREAEIEAAKDFDGKIDYSNREYCIRMKSATGEPIRVAQIAKGIKGDYYRNLVAKANEEWKKQD